MAIAHVSNRLVYKTTEGLPISKKGTVWLSLYAFHVFKNYFKQSLYLTSKYLDNLKYPLGHLESLSEGHTHGRKCNKLLKLFCNNLCTQS